MFGEGVLSASFIPVYARLLAEGDEAEAGRVAGSVGALLALVVSVLCLVGVLVTPWLIDAIAPGFHGAKRDLTISLVRILFPGAGLLVLSAWCLGILNSHRKLFLSYAAAELPVMSRAVGSAEQVAAQLRGRIGSGLRHVAFFIVPSAAAFLAFGDLLAGALLQTGRFTHDDAVYVWGILAGSAIGLLASTMGRLYSSAYYALRVTRTPLRFAALRVAGTTG